MARRLLVLSATLVTAGAVTSEFVITQANEAAVDSENAERAHQLQDLQGQVRYLTRDRRGGLEKLRSILKPKTAVEVAVGLAAGGFLVHELSLHNTEFAQKLDSVVGSVREGLGRMTAVPDVEETADGTAEAATHEDSSSSSSSSSSSEHSEEGSDGLVTVEPPEEDAGSPVVLVLKGCVAVAALCTFLALRNHAHKKAAKASRDRSVVVPVEAPAEKKLLPKVAVQSVDEEPPKTPKSPFSPMSPAFRSKSAGSPPSEAGAKALREVLAATSAQARHLAMKDRRLADPSGIVHTRLSEIEERLASTGATDGMALMHAGTHLADSTGGVGATLRT